MIMANFFSKCFSELALMATAVLWAGCNVDKGSKNEKSVSNALNSFGVAEISNSFESSDSAALPHASEKDDSFANVFSKDSLDANPSAVVLLDSAKQLEVQRTRDSLMKAYFPIEWDDVEKQKDGYQYACMRRFVFAKKRDSVWNAKSDLGSVMCYYGVIADRNRLHRLGFNDGSVEDLLRGNPNVIKLRGSVKVLYKNIEFADRQTLDQDMFYRVKRAFQQRTPGLRLLYGKFLKKNSANTFEGIITLKLTIAADGTVKESSIKKSTTGVKDFDDEIRNAVSQWTFSKVKSGEVVVYVPIRFYE